MSPFAGLVRRIYNKGVIAEQLQEIRSLQDSVRRRAAFMGILSEEIRARGGAPPIIVAEEAVEIYTQGGYSTGDIDIKSPKDLTREILIEWGFERKGRTWSNEELDLYVDWLGEGLEEGPDAEARTVCVRLDQGREIRLLSIEDLIIDRMNAAKWWKDTDSAMWARVLIEVKKNLGEALDTEYLLKRARTEKIEKEVREILSDEGMDSP